MLNNDEHTFFFHFDYDYPNSNSQLLSLHALTYSILYLLPKNPFLKHSSDHISLINAREKNKAGKEDSFLGIRMEGVPFLKRAVKEGLTENMTYEQTTEEVRKQAIWLPGGKSGKRKILRQEHAC